MRRSGQEGLANRTIDSKPHHEKARSGGHNCLHLAIMGLRLRVHVSLTNSRQNSKRLAVTLRITLAFLSVANAAATTPKRILLVYDGEVYSPAALEEQQVIDSFALHIASTSGASCAISSGRHCGRSADVVATPARVSTAPIHAAADTAIGHGAVAATW